MTNSVLLTQLYIVDTRPDGQYTDCASSDNICDLVINQNICGQYVQAARSLSSSYDSFGLYRRGEIFWAPECDVNRDQIYLNADPLTAALDAQLAVVVISAILGGFAGILWPILMLTVLKKKYHGKVHPEVSLMDRIDPCIHIVKIAPLIAAIVLVGNVRGAYIL